MGEMIAVLKSSGNRPAFIDALNMAVNVGAITSAASFRSLPDILSWPADLDVFIVENVEDVFIVYVFILDVFIVEDVFIVYMLLYVTIW